MKTKLFLLNKLVRDKAIGLFEKEGAVHVEWRALDDNEDFLGALGEKMVEELEEVFEAESREHLIEELADVEEVLLALKELAQVSQKEIDEVKAAKKAKKGGFSDRSYVQYVECKVGSDLCNKFLQDEEKYPEVTREQLEALEAEMDEEDCEDEDCE